MRTPRAGLRGFTVGTVAAVGLVMAACHLPTVPGVNGSCPSTPVPAADVAIQAPDSTLVIGDSVQVFAAALNARGVVELCAAELQFASSDAGVAMVSSGGRVTAMSAGNTYIRASSGTARDSLPIKVAASVAMR